MGDLLDPNNPFAWDKIKLNLPGLENYNPAMPWIYKWNSVSQSMPAFLVPMSMMYEAKLLLNLCVALLQEELQVWKII